MPNDSRLHLAEELLEVQRTLGWMDLVIGSIEDAVYVTDKGSRLVFANQYFSDLLGIPRVFLLGQVLNKVFSIKKVNRVPIEYADEHKPPINSDIGKSGIYQWIGHEGKTLTFKLTQRKLDSIDQTVCLLQNITHEYELSHMKSDFINLASHQLRTPMTAIMTYSHMIRDGYAGLLTDDQQKLADTIVHASERMIKLVNDLLTITRLQNEAHNLPYHSVDLDEIFAQIHAELEPRITQKKLSFKLNMQEDVPALCSDPSIIHEIISNLLVNAIQYTPDEGSIKVIVKKYGNNVSIAIKDNGIGIPKEYQAHLFNQFSRADNALLAHPEGTGLGLYMIKILLDKIGGTIKFKSALNRGTTFTLRLPAAV